MGSFFSRPKKIAPDHSARIIEEKEFKHLRISHARDPTVYLTLQQYMAQQHAEAIAQHNRGTSKDATETSKKFKIRK